MKLYHGSTQIVEMPLVSYGRDNLDFGKGFYTTNLQEQAEKWVQKFTLLGKKGCINIYDFQDEGIKKKCRYKIFLEYNEEWLDFILSCRSGGKDYLNYDIIEGGIANDKVFNTIELYFSKLIDKTEALKRLKFEKPNKQICFISQEVLNNVLRYESAYELTGKNT